MKSYVIGAGGGGSWLTPALCMLIGKENVIVVDGDTLETKNLNRQLFKESDVGRNKADALADRYGCESIPRWYSFGLTSHCKSDVLIGCVDNHPARAAILQACDFEGCCAIIAANEVLSSEAYIYKPEWRGTNLDPRHFYPEIIEDRSGDPRAASIGCTGEAQEKNRQLVTANLNAASLALHLYVVHFIEGPKLDPAVLPHLPSKLVQNMTKNEFLKSTVTEKPQQERTEV